MNDEMDAKRKKRINDAYDELGRNKEKGLSSLQRVLALGGTVLLIVLLVLLVFFGLNLFDDDGEAEEVAGPTPTLAPAPTPTPTPTPEEVVEPSQSPAARVTELYGKVSTVDGEPVVDDVFNDVTVLLGPKGLRLEVDLDIEQLVDLDDLGADAEASDVVCFSVTLLPGPWLPAPEDAEGAVHAKGPVKVQVGYTEDACLDGQADEVATRAGTVEVSVDIQDRARGTVRLGSSTLDFTAEAPVED